MHDFPLTESSSSPSSARSGWPRFCPGARATRSGFGTASHEAGHVAAAIACGLSIDWATIDREVAGPGRAGCVQLTPNSLDCLPLEQFSDVSLPGSLPVDGRPLSRGTCVLLYAKTINSLAGKEAERLLSGRFTEISSSSDMLKATFLASYFPEPASFLGHARRDAASILAARRHQVEAVAEALIEDKTLDRADIDDVLSEFSPALRVERARRRQWAAMAATAEQFRMMTGGLVRLDGVCAT